MKSRLDKLDLDKQIQEKSEYREKLRGLQLKLLHAQRLLQETSKNLILVFEGPDAAGKGGVIKRLTERLDPRLVRVWSVVKPTEEEKAHHYLWRFWGKLPVMGQTAIFDRSWYGRVLVERVEGFAKKEEWKRGYREIQDFERTLMDGGTILMKYFVHITKSEQLRRFERRAADPYKNWKISEEDWRNRRKWNEHILAAEEMNLCQTNVIFTLLLCAAFWLPLTGVYAQLSQINPLLKQQVAVKPSEFQALNIKLD